MPDQVHQKLKVNFDRDGLRDAVEYGNYVVYDGDYARGDVLVTDNCIQRIG